MWKSRIDKLPPAQYFADLIQHLQNLYPGATINADLVRAMRDIWIAEWRNGQNAQDTAKATCSCDGKSIIPSAGAGRELGKRLARPPKGAKRGDFIAPDELREVTSLAGARREAEKYAQAFDRVRSAAMKLLQARGWTAAKGLRLQKLQTLLHEIKAKHDAAVAKYQSVGRSRQDAKEPALYAKPLGALGLSLRPDELPEPPPPKAKKPPKEKKPLKEKKPPKEKRAATTPAMKEPATPAWQPPANLPQTGMAGNLSVVVEAVPNEDFATSTDPTGRHRATVRIPARMFPVATLGAARALLRAFIEDNGLGGGNLPPAAGRVRLDGKPFVHISFNGRIWRVDGKWKESGQELDESGKPKDEKDCNCKHPEPASLPAEKPADSTQFSRANIQPGDQINFRGTWYPVVRVNAKSVTIGNWLGQADMTWTVPYNEVRDRMSSGVALTPSKTAVDSSTPPSGSIFKPKRERKQKAAPAEKADAKEPPKPTLSDAEAEELANLFAAASAEDKPK